MKICPTCQRNYTDDLSFCLEDGVPLAPVYGSQEPDQAKTAILPGGIRPTAEQLNSPPATVRSSTPGYAYPAAQSAEKRGGKLWLIIGAAVAIVFVGLIAVAAVVVWKAGSNSNADSSPAASEDSNRNSADASANKDNGISQPKAAETPDLEWLEGVWTGEGYQTNTKTQWAVRLTVQDDSYSIDYPDVPCKGTWKLIEKNSRSASFNEVITRGMDRCVNGTVIVEKVSGSEISCSFRQLKSRLVIATAVLTKNE
jgi:hypothetical protein